MIGDLSLGFGTLTNLLLNGSTTLQNFTASNATTTNATTTNLAVSNLSSVIPYAFPGGSLGALTIGGNLSLSNGTLSSSPGFTFPFTKLSTNEQATSTTLALLNGFLSTASSTLASTTVSSLLATNATSTDLFVSNLASTTALRVANTAYIGGNVGIGTTGPTSIWTPTLQVSGTFGGIALTSTSANGGTFSIGSNVQSATRRLSFYDETAGAYRMTIDSAGNVGIGETAPGSKLSVSGGGSFGSGYDTTAAPTGGLIIEGNVGIGTTGPVTKLHLSGNSVSGTTLAGIRLDDTSGDTNSRNWFIGGGISNYGDLQIMQSSASGGDPYNVNPRLVIGQSGNVGIGTTAPDGNLHIYGDSPYLRFTNSGDSSTAFIQKIAAASGGLRIYDGTDYSVYFKSGNVGIGTTNPATGKLQVYTTTAVPIKMESASTDATVLYMTNTDASPQSWGIGIAGSGNTHNTDSNFYIRDETGSSDKLTIKTDGNVGIGTTSPDSIILDVEGDIEVGTGTTGCVRDADNTTLTGSCVSDERLKKNIENLSGNTLEKLAQLRPVTFEWRNDEYGWLNGQPGINYGLIAQEVEQIFPEMVNTDEKGYKRVSYDISLITRILEGIRELYNEVLALKDRITALAKEFITDKLVTKELCVEDVCVTREQFMRMVEAAGTAPIAEPASEATSGGNEIIIEDIVATSTVETVPIEATSTSETVVESEPETAAETPPEPVSESALIEPDEPLAEEPTAEPIVSETVSSTPTE